MLACKNPESIVLKFDMSCAATWACDECLPLVYCSVQNSQLKKIGFTSSL
jgi:hypothetical protein